jgi:hypothetical protein
MHKLSQSLGLSSEQAFSRPVNILLTYKYFILERNTTSMVDLQGKACPAGLLFKVWLGRASLS